MQSPRVTFVRNLQELDEQLFCSSLPAILRTTELGLARWCSQMRITVHPAWRSDRVTDWSRILFRASFFFQYAALVPGCRPCFGHPCQKQPSTNIATRSRLKAKSGRPGSGGWRLQPVIRAARSMDASLSSVSLLSRERIAAITRDRLALLKTSATRKS